MVETIINQCHWRFPFFPHSYLGAFAYDRLGLWRMFGKSSAHKFPTLGLQGFHEKVICHGAKRPVSYHNTIKNVPGEKSIQFRRNFFRNCVRMIEKVFFKKHVWMDDRRREVNEKHKVYRLPSSGRRDNAEWIASVSVCWWQMWSVDK